MRRMRRKLTELRRSEKRLREAIDLLPEGIVFLDADGRYILWNRQYADIYKGSADLFKPGIRLEDTLRIGVARGEYPDAIGREEAWLEERLTRLHKPGQRHEQVLADGRCILIEERQTSDGGVIGLRIDITELRDQEKSLRFLFEANPLPMIVCDRKSGAVIAANAMASTAFGYAGDHLLSKSFQELLACGAAPPWRETDDIESLSGGEMRLVLANGELRSIAVYARPITFNDRDCVLVAAVDITDRVKAEARIAHMRHHDALTRLPNRAALEEDVAGRLAHPGAARQRTVLICLDIANFKSINEAHGHAFGDRILRLVAARLKSLVRAEGILARVGGKEFALAETGDITPAQAGALATRLLTGLGQPFIVGDQKIVLATSAGIAMTPNDGDTPQDLLKHADLALARAKEDGAGIVRFFEADMDARAQTRRQIEAELRAAIDGAILQPWYQPLVDLKTGRIAGFEALVRWPHPSRGFIAPSDFIPVAEETGQIGAIGELVLRRACRDAAAWPMPVRVAVNLSPLQFRTGTLLAVVMDALRRSGLPAERLELEITETLLMDNSDAVASTLDALRALGVRFSLDDFGTGYSSLSYLRSFPFDKIKIDRSFVGNLMSDTGLQTIVRAVIGIGQGLGMRITAEGIESAAGRDWLAANGCHEGQGFLFSAARPQAEVMAMLRGGAPQAVA